MKKSITLILILMCGVTPRMMGQGTFSFDNGYAPTRLYSIDGPLAGRGIWAHMLYGVTPGELMPIGISVEHWGMGLVLSGPIAVPGVEPGGTVYIQMVAWDGTLWGASLNGVPIDQFGRTDIVPHVLSGGTLPDWAPLFTQPAIVPIPEPASLLLAVFGAGFLLVHRFRRPCRKQNWSVSES
jgi:hypothetical protein